MTKSYIFCTALAGILVTTVPAQAANQPQSAEAEEPADSAAATTVVCRRMAPETGSRIGARNICKTELEWSRIDEEMREVVERAVRTRLNCSRDGVGTACGG